MRLSAALIRLVHAAAVVSIVALAALSLVPGQLRPHVLSSGDLEHFAAYAGTGFLIGLGWSRRLAAVALPALSAAAAGFELLQYLVPGRGPGLDNWLAGTVGAATGLMIGVVAAAALARLLAQQPEPEPG